MPGKRPDTRSCAARMCLSAGGPRATGALCGQNEMVAYSSAQRWLSGLGMLRPRSTALETRRLLAERSSGQGETVVFTTLLGIWRQKSVTPLWWTRRMVTGPDCARLLRFSSQACAEKAQDVAMTLTCFGELLCANSPLGWVVLTRTICRAQTRASNQSSNCHTHLPSLAPTASPTQTPTPSPTASPTPIPYCDAFQLVSGGGGGSPVDAGEETRHELGCCADQPVSGWTSCNGGAVWAERNGALFLDAKVNMGFGTRSSTFNGTGDTQVAGGAFYWEGDQVTGNQAGCVHNVPWELAADICHAIVIDSVSGARARLCTATELAAPSSCGVGRGCAHNSDLIW